MGQAAEPNIRIPADIERTLFHRADELASILAHLRKELSRLESNVVSTAVGEPFEPAPAPASAPAASFRYYLAERRLRKKFFPACVATGPGWHLLTSLYESYHSQLRESIGAIGLLADLAPTTTIRWVRVLESTGLVQLRGDPLDARRKWVELTPKALAALEDFFESLGRLVLPR